MLEGRQQQRTASQQYVRLWELVISKLKTLQSSDANKAAGACTVLAQAWKQLHAQPAQPPAVWQHLVEEKKVLYILGSLCRAAVMRDTPPQHPGRRDVCVLLTKYLCHVLTRISEAGLITRGDNTSTPHDVTDSLAHQLLHSRMCLQLPRLLKNATWELVEQELVEPRLEWEILPALTEATSWDANDSSSTGNGKQQHGGGSDNMQQAQVVDVLLNAQNVLLLFTLTQTVFLRKSLAGVHEALCCVTPAANLVSAVTNCICRQLQQLNQLQQLQQELLSHQQQQELQELQQLVCPTADPACPSGQLQQTPLLVGLAQAAYDAALLVCSIFVCGPSTSDDLLEKQSWVEVYSDEAVTKCMTLMLACTGQALLLAHNKEQLQAAAPAGAAGCSSSSSCGNTNIAAGASSYQRQHYYHQQQQAGAASADCPSSPWASYEACRGPLLLQLDPNQALQLAFSHEQQRQLPAAQQELLLVLESDSQSCLWMAAAVVRQEARQDLLGVLAVYMRLTEIVWEVQLGDPDVPGMELTCEQEKVHELMGSWLLHFAAADMRRISPGSSSSNSNSEMEELRSLLEASYLAFQISRKAALRPHVPELAAQQQLPRTREVLRLLLLQLRRLLLPLFAADAGADAATSCMCCLRQPAASSRKRKGRAQQGCTCGSGPQARPPPSLAVREAVLARVTVQALLTQLADQLHNPGQQTLSAASAHAAADLQASLPAMMELRESRTAAVWSEYAVQHAALLEAHIRSDAARWRAGGDSPEYGFGTCVAMQMLTAHWYQGWCAGPLVQAAMRAGPGSAQQVQLFSCLNSLLKSAAIHGAAYPEVVPDFQVAVASTVVTLLHQAANSSSCGQAGGGGTAAAAAADGSSTGSGGSVADAAVAMLPCLVLFGRCCQQWAAALRHGYNVKTQRFAYKQQEEDEEQQQQQHKEWRAERHMLAAIYGKLWSKVGFRELGEPADPGSVFFRRLDTNLFGAMLAACRAWLEQPVVSAQLQAAGYGDTLCRLPAVLDNAEQCVDAAHTEFGRLRDPVPHARTCSKGSFDALVEGIEQLGRHLAAFAVPHFCNNSACRNASGPTELLLVSGAACVCVGVAAQHITAVWAVSSSMLRSTGQCAVACLLLQLLLPQLQWRMSAPVDPSMHQLQAWMLLQQCRWLVMREVLCTLFDAFVYKIHPWWSTACEWCIACVHPVLTFCWLRCVVVLASLVRCAYAYVCICCVHPLPTCTCGKSGLWAGYQLPSFLRRV